MAYKVTWDKKAYSQLEKLNPLLAKRIVNLIKEFSQDINSKEIKRLKGEKSFRLRAGDYRIILDLDNNSETITILKVGHRKNIYDK